MAQPAQPTAAAAPAPQAQADQLAPAQPPYKPKQMPGVLLFTLALSLMFAITAALYFALWFAQYGGVEGAPGVFDLITEKGTVDALLSLGEITVGVLAVVLTVVAILVELAATRYTPRITRLFLRDGINITAMLGFVVIVVLVFWVEMSLFGPEYPVVMALGASIALTIGVLGLVPYFAYVFRFLLPDHVIGHVAAGVTKAVLALPKKSPARVEKGRKEAVDGVEQLADILTIAIKEDDKGAAIKCIDALGKVARDALRVKPSLPGTWFNIQASAESDRDLAALHPEMIRSMSVKRLWFELKVLRAFQAAFEAAMLKVPDVAHIVAIETQRIAAAGFLSQDPHVLQLSVRFMNSYLAASIGGGAPKSAYNVLNEYRDLALFLLQSGQYKTSQQLADRMRHYAHVAFEAGEQFVAVTVAHDLVEIRQLAARSQAPNLDQLLRILLEVDQEPDQTDEQETALRGVRKAQIRLATYFLANGDTARAKRIQGDMAHENNDRLASIHREMSSLAEPELFEIGNRERNWDWLPDNQRAVLSTFFAWFHGDFEPGGGSMSTSRVLKSTKA